MFYNLGLSHPLLSNSNCFVYQLESFYLNVLGRACENIMENDLNNNIIHAGCLHRMIQEERKKTIVNEWILTQNFSLALSAYLHVIPLIHLFIIGIVSCWVQMISCSTKNMVVACKV